MRSRYSKSCMKAQYPNGTIWASSFFNAVGVGGNFALYMPVPLRYIPIANTVRLLRRYLKMVFCNYCGIQNESAYHFALYEQESCNALIKKIARWKHELDADRAKLPRGDVALMDAHDDAICHLLNAIDEIAERRRKVDRAVDSWEMAQGSKAWTA